MTDFNLQGIGMTSRRTRNRLVDRLRSGGIDDERVLDAIASVPRHIFIDEALAHLAYEDTALPIGHSQNHLATLHRRRHDRCRTELRPAPQAVAAPRRRRAAQGAGNRHRLRLAKRLFWPPWWKTVYSVERIGALLGRARERLRALSIRNVHLKHADGNLGWPGAAPFDAVLVTAGASHVPDALMEQMADGAPLVIPVGSGEVQQLKVFERNGDAWRQRTLEDVRFVPMLRGVRT